MSSRLRGFRALAEGGIAFPHVVTLIEGRTDRLRPADAERAGTRVAPGALVPIVAHGPVDLARALRTEALRRLIDPLADRANALSDLVASGRRWTRLTVTHRVHTGPGAVARVGRACVPVVRAA